MEALCAGEDLRLVGGEESRAHRTESRGRAGHPETRPERRRGRGRPFSPHAPLKDNHSLIISYYYFPTALPRVSALSVLLRSHRDLLQIPPNSPPSQAPAESPHPAASSPHPRICLSFSPILPLPTGQSSRLILTIRFVPGSMSSLGPTPPVAAFRRPARSTSTCLAASDVIPQVPSVAQAASARAL